MRVGPSLTSSGEQGRELAQRCFSSYPEVLENAIITLCEKAPDVPIRAFEKVGQMHVKLLVPREVVPIYGLFWTYVRKSDLAKLPIHTAAMETVETGEEEIIYVSELTKHHIEVEAHTYNASWDSRGKTVRISVRSFQRHEEKDHIYFQMGSLTFELGNASIDGFYRALPWMGYTQEQFIYQVEMQERNVYKRTGRVLREIGVPEAYNSYLLTYPKKLYLVAAEVFGHIRHTSRFYNEVNWLSPLPPPPSKWPHPISEEDRESLSNLIYWNGMVNYASKERKLQGCIEIAAAEMELSQESDIYKNWEWFKGLCREKGLFYKSLWELNALGEDRKTLYKLASLMKIAVFDEKEENREKALRLLIALEKTLTKEGDLYKNWKKFKQFCKKAGIFELALARSS